MDTQKTKKEQQISNKCKKNELENSVILNFIRNMNENDIKKMITSNVKKKDLEFEGFVLV